MLDYNYGNREESEPALTWHESIDDMHKVYPRDRDLPMLLLWCYHDAAAHGRRRSREGARAPRAILTVEYQDSPQARKLLRHANGVGAIMDDAVLADRFQFAFTVMFHYLFPIGTMGLAPFVAAYTWKAARDGDEDSARSGAFLDEDLRDQLCRRRRDRHSDGVSVRDELGGVLARERARSSVSRSRWKACSRSFSSRSFWACCYTAAARIADDVARLGVGLCLLGAWLSGFFIVATDAWMQHPVGYAIGPGGTILLQNIWALLSRRGLSGSSRTC